jgi:hypothetical protein
MSTIWATSPPTRVTLQDDAGNGLVRWTLQLPTREGRELRFLPEGQLRPLGSGTAWKRQWIFEGFRQELGLTWSAGMQSSREAWVSGAWGTPETCPTATAHSEILDWAAQHPCLVEPFLGQPCPSFKAQAFEKGPALRDTKGIVHPNLELALRAVQLARSIVLIQSANLGWGLGPWGLLAWGD